MSYTSGLRLTLTCEDLYEGFDRHIVVISDQSCELLLEWNMKL